MNRFRHRRSVTIAVLLLAVSIRCGFLATHLQSLDDDPDAYRTIAVTLGQTGVFGLMNGNATVNPTAFRPPLYPWLLSWLVDSSGRLLNSSVACLHALLGGMTILMTWDMARRYLSANAGMLAVLLVTIDPILLWQSTLVMTETLATFLAVGVCWFWCVQTSRRGTETTSIVGNSTLSAAVLGLLLSLSFLCRPTFLVWSVLVIPMLGWARPECNVRRAMMILVCSAVVVGTVGIWTLRNVAAVGKPIWATTHGGYTLLLANNDSFYDYLLDRQPVLPWQKEPWDATAFFESIEQLPRSGDEPSDDEVAYKIAKETISRRPTLFVYSCWVRFVRLWHPFPHRTPGRSSTAVAMVGVFHSSIYLMIMVAAVRHRYLLHWRRWRMIFPLWPMLALAITLSGVHAVYWSNPRMRAPIIPLLAIVAAASISPKKFDPSPIQHE